MSNYNRKQIQIKNNITKCSKCGKELGNDKYVLDPRTGYKQGKYAWCSTCYEYLIGLPKNQWREDTWEFFREKFKNK